MPMEADCKASGVLRPVIDRNRCEGKEDCVAVCPYKVFAIQRLTATEKVELSFVGRLKAFAHGNKQAFVVRGDECHSCGLCVAACPEHAITLARPGG